MTEQGPEDNRGDSQAAQLKGANERIEGREARIANLRRRIVDGSYCVDPVKLSAKIVDRHCRVGS